MLALTGATGMIGWHIAAEARRRGMPVRALVRKPGEAAELQQLGVALVQGDMTDADSLARLLQGSRTVVHAAAAVGDWGPVSLYEAVNVHGTASLLAQLGGKERAPYLVMISSLGVYGLGHHYGDDEETPPAAPGGPEGYLSSKRRAEELVRSALAAGLRGAVLRPGFVYGPRDRHVLPSLMSTLARRKFAYLGDGQKLLDNTSVHNVVDAVMRVISQQPQGRVYNVRDRRLVTRREFISTVARHAGLPEPDRHVPLWLAWPLTRLMDGCGRRVGLRKAPLLTIARYKFLALNLDYSIKRICSELGYTGEVDFDAAMGEALAWFRQEGVAA